MVPAISIKPCWDAPHWTERYIPFRETPSGLSLTDIGPTHLKPVPAQRIRDIEDSVSRVPSGLPLQKRRPTSEKSHSSNKQLEIHFTGKMEDAFVANYYPDASGRRIMEGGRRKS